MSLRQDGANGWQPHGKDEGRIKNYETSNARLPPPSLILFSLDLLRHVKSTSLVFALLALSLSFARAEYEPVDISGVRDKITIRMGQKASFVSAWRPPRQSASCAAQY
jgi:hypothetical protein